MTRPTTTLPLTTNSPNAFTTLPASPVVRISRVTDTLIARRNMVVSSSRLGNAAKSSALPRYIVAHTIVSAPAMLSVISRLSSSDGSGTTSIVTTSTTETAASRSVWRSILRRPAFTTRASLRGRAQAHAGGRCRRPCAAPGEPVDEGEHARDGRVELLRDHLADLDGCVQRARERRVGDRPARRALRRRA